MIKLFWNTHNQIATNPKEPSGEDERNYIWGLYHKDHSKKWIYELLSKVRFETIEDERKINSKDILEELIVLCCCRIDLPCVGQPDSRQVEKLTGLHRAAHDLTAWNN